jgi:hypothetical protein
MSATVQEHLRVNLNYYIPLLYMFRLLVFICEHICEYLLGLLETYYSKNSLSLNKRTYFLIISSFNYLSLISQGYI